jgi:methyl-accepting chemotaxis protein
MHRLYRFRISHKMISIALFGFAGLLSFGTIYQISSSSRDVSHAVAENAASIADLNQRISINVLDARRVEKDFSSATTIRIQSFTLNCRYQSITVSTS